MIYSFHLSGHYFSSANWKEKVKLMNIAGIRFLIFCQCLYFKVYDTLAGVCETLEALISLKSFLNIIAEHEAMNSCLSK